MPLLAQLLTLIYLKNAPLSTWASHTENIVCSKNFSLWPNKRTLICVRPLTRYPAAYRAHRHAPVVTGIIELISFNVGQPWDAGPSTLSHSGRLSLSLSLSGGISCHFCLFYLRHTLIYIYTHIVATYIYYYIDYYDTRYKLRLISFVYVCVCVQYFI